MCRTSSAFCPRCSSSSAGFRKPEANRLQVRVELQADCFAGIWAARSDQQWKLIQPGDVEAAMRTAAAIGDDRLQKQAQGYVIPDSFTHGSSEQRQRWFQTGLKSRHRAGLQYVCADRAALVTDRRMTGDGNARHR